MPTREEITARIAEEDSAPDSALPPEALKRKRARFRKRDQRAEEKQSEGCGSPEEFWAKNIEVAKPDQIAKMRKREQEVFGILHDMELVMNGQLPDEQFAADVEAEVTQDVAAHGTVGVEVSLLEFWSNPNIFAQLMSRGGPTADFVRYGLVTAIPDHRLHEWQSWLASRKSATPVEKYEWAKMQCRCGAPPSTVPKHIADGYREKGIPFKCGNCLRGEVPFKAAPIEQKLPENNLYDSVGRIKDQ